MTIRLGSATFDAAKDIVTIDTRGVAGFDTVKAVRLTNYTADAIVLTGISGLDPNSVEYLMPLQQMVYHTDNISSVPVLKGLQLGTDLNAAAVFVEWSTEPELDFIGTYPTQVSAIPIVVGIATIINTSVIGTAAAGGLFTGSAGVTRTVPSNAKRVSITLINQSTGAQNIYFGGSSNAHGADWAAGALQTPVIVPNGGVEFSAQGSLFVRGDAGAILAIIEEQSA